MFEFRLDVLMKTALEFWRLRVCRLRFPVDTFVNTYMNTNTNNNLSKEIVHESSKNFIAITMFNAKLNKI